MILVRATPLLLAWSFGLHGQIPSFPGAEGYGATASGGRGKRVIAVTNLNDDGKGSFREAVGSSNATIVFRVSGVIHLHSNLQVGSNLTIAGQTAPGSGVTVADAKVSLTDSTNVIVRFMRFRGGIEEGPRVSSLNLGNASHVMLDHVSVEWGRWDNIQSNGNTYTTIQNSIVGEGIDPQRFGCLCESDYLTLSRNLWIDNKSRNPKGKIQYVNNVVYNWGVDGYVGGHSGAEHTADIIGNYFIAGPNSSDAFIGEFTSTDVTYQAGNFFDGNRNGKLDGRPVTREDFERVHATLRNATTAEPSIPVRVEAAPEMVNLLAGDVGDTHCRDAVDARLIAELLTFGRAGRIIDREGDVGGNPQQFAEIAPIDTDGDGIPDEWEMTHHLDPHDPKDGQAIDRATGFSNLEIYLNELAARPAVNCQMPSASTAIER